MKKPKGGPSRSDDIIEFIQKYLIVPEGLHVGRPVRLRDWQKDIIRQIYDTPTRNAIVSMARKNGKGLALDTPIPTPDGWRTMAAIMPGDVLYDDQGLPCRVTMVSPVRMLDCYRVTFSNGERIVCDGDHLWKTTARVRRPGSGYDITTAPATAVRDTREIFATQKHGARGDRNHSIDMPAPIVGLPHRLLVAPYLLGVWLGDGNSASARVTVGREDIDAMLANIRGAGAMATARAATSCYSVLIQTAEADVFGNTVAVPKRVANNFQILLRSIGVLGNKHIPAEYLRASVADRMALLQGLMDTDGHISKSGRILEYSSVSGQLADNVAELLASLGIKYSLRRTAMRCNGTPVPGTSHRLQFMAFADDMPAFRLPRKRARQLLRGGVPARSRTVQITSVERVDTVPTKCLQVDSPSRMFRVGLSMLPTHNSALISMLMLAHLVGPEARRNAQIYSAAQSRDQAGIVFGLASKMVRMSPELNDINMVVVRESAKELYSPLTGVRYKALSADATTAYGFSPVLVIHDELGQVRGERSELYDALETAMGAQVEPLSIVISTQAPTALDLLSKLIDDAKTGADPTHKLILFAANDDDAIDDEATWRKANPALGDFLNIEEFRGLARTAARMPSAEATFRNLNLNLRVSALNQLFSQLVWEANGAECDLSTFEEEPVYAGLDLSAKQDMTALVLIAKREGKWHVWPHFWTPEATLRERAARDRAPYDVWVEQGFLTAVPGVTIDYGFVAQRLAEISKRCDLRVIRYDRWRIEDLKAALSAIGCELPLEECGQGFRDIAPAIDALEVECLQANLRHGNHPVLYWNTANAIVVADAAGNRKFEKVKATGRIDGLVALAMAVGAAAMSQQAQIIDIRSFIA